MYKVFVLLALVMFGCSFDPGIAPSDRSETGLRTDDGTPAPDTSTRDTSRDAGPTDTGKDLNPPDVSRDVEADSNDGGQREFCEGELKNLQTDPKHCGQCNNECDPEFGRCAEGACACPGDSVTCGIRNKCTATKRDPNNCGECGVRCGTAERCDDGACVCRDGYTLCGGECVDTRNDPQHCGECGNECSTNRSCRDSNCRISCNFDFTCFLSGPNACVSNTQRSEWYCAASLMDSCGNRCAGDESCSFQEGRRGCREFRPTIECESCPCDECEADESCIVDREVNAGPICVKL